MAVTPHRISVGELVEQTVRGGDINFRFQPRSSATEGIRGHQRLQKSRGDNYVAERSITMAIQKDGLTLEVKGRVDGYFPDTAPIVVEEIKTLRTDAAELPASVQAVHWAQARLYARALALEAGVDRVLVRLCYLQLDDDSEHTLEAEESLASLQTFFDSLIDRYLQRLRRLNEWREARDAAIDVLDFPHGDYRPGQRDMAVSVYRALSRERQLVIQAPTGIGKTVAALFPAVKAMAANDYDKLFYLTAKTSGQQMAQGTIATLKNHGLALRDVTLSAKDKVCFNPGSPCDPDHCEYARGYYDRLPAAIDSALGTGQSFDRDLIEEKAAAFTVCPFEFSLDLSRWADVIICDYNYVFDPAVYLRRYFDEPGGNYGLLVDECHNLVDRGRDMFSAEVIKGHFLAVRRELKSALPGVAKRLSRVNAEILELRRDAAERFEAQGHLRTSDVPAKAVRAMREFCAAAEDWLKLNEPAPFQESLLQLYFDCVRFVRTAEFFGDNFVCLLMKRGKDMALKLYCIDPAPGLGEGFGRVSGAVGFSATMSPQPYFHSLLGMGDAADWYRLPSPWASEHLGVFIASHISTAWRDRQSSLDELVELIATVVGRKAGNYLVFFPSYAYMQATLARFAQAFPDIDTMAQWSGMSDDEREAFLGRFDEAPCGTLVGFAVMGGVFGEGIDLKGTRLIGVIVAGVGLPQVGIERDLIREYFESSGQGFEFAYQYPGMNRVLQTAGRVIRDEADRGIVCLVDSRFAQQRYWQLYPPEWNISLVSDSEALARGVAAFWDQASLAH